MTEISMWKENPLNKDEYIYCEDKKTITYKNDIYTNAPSFNVIKML